MRLVPDDTAVKPVLADSVGLALSYEVDVDGQPVQLAAVSMGNPHAVLRDRKSVV